MYPRYTSSSGFFGHRLTMMEKNSWASTLRQPLMLVCRRNSTFIIWKIQVNCAKYVDPSCRKEGDIGNLTRDI